MAFAHLPQVTTFFLGFDGCLAPQLRRGLPIGADRSAAKREAGAANQFPLNYDLIRPGRGFPSTMTSFGPAGERANLSDTLGRRHLWSALAFFFFGI